VVTGADGICGRLAVGYLSFPDSRGYGRYGFRPSDVPCLLASTWSGMLQPRGTPVRRAPGACGGPRSGKFSGGNKDGSRDVAGTPAAPCWEPGVFHPCRDIYLLRSSRLGGSAGPLRGLASGSYLVDSASSHMLVSKIKPCMSKYKHSCTVKLRMAH
jgi:hypothetical protein